MATLLTPNLIAALMAILILTSGLVSVLITGWIKG